MMQVLRVPANLDLKHISQETGLPYKKRQADKIYFVCDSIYNQMIHLDENGYHREKVNCYFVPLSATILKKALGNEYLNIINWMIQGGVIIADNSWKENVVSKGYRFSNKYLLSDARFVTIHKQYGIPGLVQESNIQRFQPQVCNNLKKWFQSKKLTLDGSAVDVVSSFKDEAMKTRDMPVQLQAQIDFNNRMALISEMQTGNYKFMDTDKFGHRFFSPITRMPKFLRSLVKYEGEGLCQVDIANSQLFFLNYLLDWRNYPELKNCGRKNYKNHIWSNIVDSRTYKCIDKTIMFLKNSEKQYGKGFQKHPFFLKTAQGRFYEDIIDQLDQEDFFCETMTAGEKRSKVKNLLLKQLFANPGDNRHKGLYMGNNLAVWECFTKIYPEIAFVVAQLKEYDHKNLSRLLQRIESAAILGCVCKRMRKSYPDIPVFTLHDCIVTPQKHQEIVEQVMREEIALLMGNTPRLSIDSWSSYAGLLPAMKQAA